MHSFYFWMSSKKSSVIIDPSSDSMTTLTKPPNYYFGREKVTTYQQLRLTWWIKSKVKKINENWTKTTSSRSKDFPRVVWRVTPAPSQFWTVITRVSAYFLGICRARFLHRVGFFRRGHTLLEYFYAKKQLQHFYAMDDQQSWFMIPHVGCTLQGAKCDFPVWVTFFVMFSFSYYSHTLNLIRGWSHDVWTF